ncbi:MAG: hypothetical protein ACNA75_06595, partial [Thiohalomonadaceae bacterium]
MDEKEFKKTIRDVNNAPCIFAKALLRRCCGCSRAEKLFIGEREAVACKSPGARQLCDEVLGQLHHKAIFALHLPHAEVVLPHGKELKVQCGGMLGLQASLDESQIDAERVADIYGLLTAAVAEHGSVEALPYSQVVRGITRFQPRE